MTFEEILVQIVEVLRCEPRVSYRALRRRFGLDEEYLEDFKVEIIQAKQLATDEDNTILGWGCHADVGQRAETPASSQRWRLWRGTGSTTRRNGWRSTPYGVRCGTSPWPMAVRRGTKPGRARPTASLCAWLRPST